MEIRICKTDEQLARLADLASAIWHEYFAPLLSAEQIDYMVQQYQSLEALTRAVRQEDYTYFLAYEGEELVGYCGVKPDGDRLFLSKLYLRSDMRGKHLGRKPDGLQRHTRIPEVIKAEARIAIDLHIGVTEESHVLSDRRRRILTLLHALHGNGLPTPRHIINLSRRRCGRHHRKQNGKCRRHCCPAK